MKFNPTFILACVVWLAVSGCACRQPAVSADGFPERIGVSRERDSSEMDAFEFAVAGLLDHLADAVTVLEHVEDAASSNHAAGMIDEAAGRFVSLRLGMKQAEPDREISTAELIVKYGSVYLWASSALDRELKRIKSLGPEVHGPVESSLLRLREDLQEAGLPAEL